MRQQRSTQVFSQSALFAMTVAFAYFLINSFYLLIPVAPSDPLQYAGPAIAPSNGFDFLDRVFLWLWVRFFTLLPIPNAFVGGIATLTNMTIILGLGIYWLSKRFSPLAGAIFCLLFVSAPMALAISNYTYPTQLLTLLLLTSAFLLEEGSSLENDFAGGIAWGFACLTKIQALPFSFFYLIQIFLQKQSNLSRFRKWLLFSVGSIVGVLLVIICLIVLDGFAQTLSLFTSYFHQGTAQRMYSGRNEGGIPPLYKLLEPPPSF